LKIAQLILDNGITVNLRDEVIVFKLYNFGYLHSFFISLSGLLSIGQAHMAEMKLFHC